MSRDQDRVWPTIAAVAVFVALSVALVLLCWSHLKASV